jgi:protein O-mannosyl-transferase
MTQQQPEQDDVENRAAAGEPGEVEDQGEQLVLTSPEDARSPKEMALWAGVILLVALTVYGPALRGDFLWDDDRHVSANRNLRDFNGLVDIWTKLGIPAGGTVQYYPLTHTTFWLEYQLSGARPGEIGTTVFHVTNVVLHVIGAILLWLVLRELKVPGSWVAATIWALHPLQVESVAWISERKNVLAGVFFFGAILAYLRSGFGLERRGDPAEEATRGPAHPGLYWLSLALFACALLSKTVTVSVPAVVLLLLWWKRGRLTVKDFAATAPFFLLGFGMAALTAWMERTQVGARGPEWDAITASQRVLIAGRAIWFYIEKNLWPAGLSFIYPRWNMAAANAMWWFYPAAVVIVAAVLFALRRWIGRGPVVAFSIFCGVLVPALGFFDFYPMRYSFVADHFQYLASPALIALVVAAAAVALRKLAPRATAAPYVLAGIVLVVLSTLTLLQARVYAGPLLLWDDAIKKNPAPPPAA